MPTVAENLLKVNEGIDKVEALNEELAQSLYGGDTGYRGHYDAFWDSYQENGNRVDYSCAFTGSGWTEQTFKPKYDIAPTNTYMLFRYNAIKVDLVEYLNNLGVKLDFSKSLNTQHIFGNSAFTRIGVVDVSSARNSVSFEGAFTGNSNLVTIDKLVIKTGTSGEFNSGTFNGCSALENVVFEGLITKNGLDMQWSKKLSKASIENIIDCLSTTSSGTSITLSKAAVNKAFETSEGANDGTTSVEWGNLIATKPNWTISLV